MEIKEKVEIEEVIDETLTEEEWRQPAPGSWADIARFMAQGDDSGFDWDAWKDEMKEADLGE